GRDCRARQHARRRRDLGDCYADEEVRDAPDHGHQAEQNEPAPCHRWILGETVTSPIFSDFGLEDLARYRRACLGRPIIPCDIGKTRTMPLDALPAGTMTAAIQDRYG